MIKRKASIYLIIFILLFAFACKKEKILSDSSAKLRFSVDSILFDTVFSTVGSATKYLKAYNPYDQKIIISSIYLKGGTASNFTINVDGVASTSVKDIELYPKDSLYIFIEVTVDPTNMNNPMVLRDEIVFVTNGNTQNVILEAWGQDAYYHTPTEFPDKIPAYSYAGCSSAWKNDKPHLIYGDVVVDSDSTLTIPAGTKVYMHKNAVLWVYEGGTLIINGKKDSIVSFQGDRLESAYKDEPGQWDRIWLSAGSKDNVINYAVIRNGNVGIQVDTVANSNPTLTITNTIIENMAGVGILAQGSVILGTNCLVANCGIYNLALTIGGLYNFTHCTFANFWKYSYRDKPLLLLNNYYEDISHTIHVRGLADAYFGNCIIYGNGTNEIGFDFYEIAGSYDYEFDHCLLKTTSSTSVDSIYKDIVLNPAIDAVFNNYANNNYTLSATSAARDKGDITITNTFSFDSDIEGTSRTLDAKPDIGAYEYK